MNYFVFFPIYRGRAFRSGIKAVHCSLVPTVPSRFGKAKQMVSLLSGAGWLLFFGLGFLVLNAARSLWFVPKKLEKIIRQQGIQGSSYRFPFGDIWEFRRSMKEAESKPFPFSHDILPRVLPWMHQGIYRYGTPSLNCHAFAYFIFTIKVFRFPGKFFLTWLGPLPRVVINDPQLAREILSEKSGNIGKSKLNPFTKFMVAGTIAHEGEKWAKHRKIVNRAFQIDKLKVEFLRFFCLIAR